MSHGGVVRGAKRWVWEEGLFQRLRGRSEHAWGAILLGGALLFPGVKEGWGLGGSRLWCHGLGDKEGCRQGPLRGQSLGASRAMGTEGRLWGGRAGRKLSPGRRTRTSSPSPIYLCAAPSRPSRQVGFSLEDLQSFWLFCS